MTTNELMIGNYVEFENQLHQVIGITDDEINLSRKSDSGKRNIAYWVGIYSVKPISLIEKWLLDFGFEKIYDDCFIYNTIILNSKFELMDIDINVKCKHVHQLQNLHFSLKETHLQLVEPKYPTTSCGLQKWRIDNP